MPNTDSKFNPAYSTISKIILVDINKKDLLDISKRNVQCQFERIEFAENITDIFPSGALIVRDTTDTVSYIAANKINKIKIVYADGTYTYFDITSTAYINNAASKTDETYVSIYFSNYYYKYVQTHSLNADLLSVDPYWAIPQVYRVHELVQYITQNILYPQINTQAVGTTDQGGVGSQTRVTQVSVSTSTINTTTNYAVYKPLNPKEYRIESPTDNAIQYLNYLASLACSNPTLAKSTNDTAQYAVSPDGDPRFMFWTDFNNKINFKYFPQNITDDITAIDSTIDTNFLRFGVFDGDAVIQKLSDGKKYRKIYHLRTDPNDQYVSKNYHYIRKTPKIFDVAPADTGNSYYANVLSYQFQDEGQKYNIELINSKGLTGATAGSDEFICENHWGYYNELEPVNDGKSLTHLGQNFGNQKGMASLNFMGGTAYFQYVDNPEMWKNMFDMTEVHPHYPDEKYLTSLGIAGGDTNLQKILSIRYANFIKELGGNYTNDRLELMRQIERQNFIMYALCCMSKQEESFFAKLTAYEIDNTLDKTQTEAYRAYRYNWVKINFNGKYGATGPVSSQSGNTYYVHQVERWGEDAVWKGSTFQNDTWAINLNERTVSNSYLPPGWVPSAPSASNFKWRPIGCSAGTFNPTTNTNGKINHIVKMNAIPMTDILATSGNTATSYFLGKYLYYFTAENIVDGTC